VSEDAHGRQFEPFFLPASEGERFCMFHPVAGTPRGAVLYLHPFAEEMNKSRRMTALQSRALAADGFAVLQIDLFGCGDSSGEFGEASWEIWRQDVALGARWLRQQVGGGVTLWGLRLGALLALDAARHCDPAPEEFVLWQPVVSGEQFLTQFLRLRVAGEMISVGAAKTGTRQLRGAFDVGNRLEIAGYDLAPGLAQPIDALKLIDLAPRGGRVHWLEIVPEAVVPESQRTLAPAAQRVADSWTRSGVQFEVRCVPGQPFWNTLEITECPELITATTQVLAGGCNESQ